MHKAKLPYELGRFTLDELALMLKLVSRHGTSYATYSYTEGLREKVQWLWTTTCKHMEVDEDAVTDVRNMW